MNVKRLYQVFSEQHYLPLQLQPWWLDAVCERGFWNAALAEGPPGQIRAVWPWFRTTRMGIPMVTLPPFTSYGGPWPANDDAANGSKYTAEYKIYAQLIEQLPNPVFFRQSMHPDRQNWLPLHWAGFRQSVRYTYRLQPTLGLENVWSNLFPSLRSHIRKAGRQVCAVRADSAIGALWALNAASWRRQGLRQPHDFQTFSKLHEALSGRNHSALWLAFGTDRPVPVAALYLIFDSRYAGVLLTGSDAGGRSAAALHALYWEAIRFSLSKGLVFDFEGSMHPGIERAFRAYNGVLTPYNRIYKWLS